MKVFVAGASGAIGRPLIAELIRQGHKVTGMSQSEAGAQELMKQGAAAEVANALDASSMERAIHHAKPEIVIDELTRLPKHPAEIQKYLPGDTQLRIEGSGNLHRIAQSYCVRRYLQQSSGFFLRAGNGLADETEPMAVDATPGVATSARMYAELEKHAELRKNGRRPAALWILLRSQHLVSQGGRCSGPCAETAISNCRRRSRSVVLRPY